MKTKEIFYIDQKKKFTHFIGPTYLNLIYTSCCRLLVAFLSLQILYLYLELIQKVQEQKIASIVLQVFTTLYSVFLINMVCIFMCFHEKGEQFNYLLCCKSCSCFQNLLQLFFLHVFVHMSTSRSNSFLGWVLTLRMFDVNYFFRELATLYKYLFNINVISHCVIVCSSVQC